MSFSIASSCLASSASLSFINLISSDSSPSSRKATFPVQGAWPNNFSPNLTNQLPPFLSSAFALANLAVSFARFFRARRRQQRRTMRNINAHPRVMRRISHHSSGLRLEMTVGELSPVMLGKGAEGFVPEALGTSTRSDKQTPRPGTTFDD